MSLLYIRTEIEVLVDHFGLDESYIIEIQGTILDDEELIGKIDGYRVAIAAWESDGRPGNLWDVAESTDLAELMEVLFDRDGALSDWCAGRLPMSGSDVLLVNSVTLHQRARGNDIGLLALWRFIRLHAGGCGFVLCKPSPLDRVAETASEIEEGAAALERHWMRLGFVPVESATAFLWLDLDLKHPTPPFAPVEPELHAKVRPIQGGWKP